MPGEVASTDDGTPVWDARSNGSATTRPMKVPRSQAAQPAACALATHPPARDCGSAGGIVTLAIRKLRTGGHRWERSGASEIDFELRPGTVNPWA